MKFLSVLFLTSLLTVAAFAQRPRSMEPTDASKATPPAPPQTMKAKYEGGVFGHTHTMDGTLSFDDTNSRLLFKKDGQEVLFIPYNAVTSAFADTQKKRPTAATVASNVPYFGFPLGLIKRKVRYLTLQFSDPDTHVSGVTSFRLENQSIVDSALYALAQKANLSPRGTIYVKKHP
ncbi:MAG TPA: hypothetical protein VJT50_14210 [Pyrinomonadaceae bacterium]|nr:hypothetical protein [Pyrinomonadaceae bacterium]